MAGYPTDQYRWTNVRGIAQTLGDVPRLTLATLMLAVFTVSVGFGVALPLLPYLIERLMGAEVTPGPQRTSTPSQKPIRSAMWCSGACGASYDQATRLWRTPSITTS